VERQITFDELERRIELVLVPFFKNFARRMLKRSQSM
jgi:hypothetical protein